MHCKDCRFWEVKPHLERSRFPWGTCHRKKHPGAWMDCNGEFITSDQFGCIKFENKEFK